MGTLTKYNALVGELEPYTPSRLALQKALADVKISDWDNEYNADTDQRTIAIAAIKVLKRMIVLTNDTLGKSSQGYSVEKLERRIKDLCNENGLDVSDFVEVSSITDGSICGDMARNNGTFRYTALPLEATRNEATGFYTDDDAPVWVKGCECQVEKFIPAKQRLGTDGQMYSYTFDVFLPSYFEGDLSIGARVEVTLERGGVDEFTISGIDDTNPKYIEIWG